MPIITPSYPSMCATHNITYSTKEVIKRELIRGGSIAEMIFNGKASWKDLFVKQTFFVDGYKYYLCIVAASTTKDAQKTWSGRVESKVRTLVQDVEQHESINVAHPFNKGFKRVHKCTTDEDVEAVKSGSMKFIAEEIPTETTDLSHDPNPGGTVKEETIVKDEKFVKEETNIEEEKPTKDGKVTMVYTETFYVGLEMYEGKFSTTTT